MHPPVEARVSAIRHSSTTRTKLRSINANTKPNALTRREAEAMWENSGTYLHRLTMKKFFTPETNDENPWAYIDTQVSKIVDLLTDHIIAIPNPQRMLLVSFDSPNGRAQGTLMHYDLNNKTMRVKTTSIE
jgi:hypothetical protein